MSSGTNPHLLTVSQKSLYRKKDRMETSRGLRGLTSMTLNGTNNPLNVSLGNDGLSINNSTASSDADAPPEFTMTQNILAYGSGMLLILGLMWCSRSRVPGVQHHRGVLIRQRFEERRRRRLRRQRLEDPALRQECLEKALAKARIKSFDATSQQLRLGRTDGSTVHNTNDDNEPEQPLRPSEETEDTSTCVICLEVFEVGDTVAWSRKATTAMGSRTNSGHDQESCRHVFHNDCISGWLARHEDCPSCRLTLIELPEDIDLDEDEDEENRGSGEVNAGDQEDCCSTEGSSCDENDDILNASRHSLGDYTALVIVRGLVSRVRRASMSLVGQTIDAAAYVAPSPLRRVLSTGRATTANSKHRRRWSFRSGGGDGHTARFHGKRSPPTDSENNMRGGSLPMRRVQSIGPGSPVRRPRLTSYDYDDDDDDDSLSDGGSNNLAPYPLPAPRAFGVPFRRTSSVGARSVASVPEHHEESLTEDYEDDILIPTVARTIADQYQEITTDDDDDDHDDAETSDDHTVPTSTQRQLPRLIPFRRVMSAGGAYSALSTTYSGGGGSADEEEGKETALHQQLLRNETGISTASSSLEKSDRVRQSVSWRDSRLAVSKSEDECDPFIDTEEED